MREAIVIACWFLLATASTLELAILTGLIHA